VRLGAECGADKIMTMLGKKHSEATKKLMSEKAKGNKSFTGHKHTEEWKRKMRHPRPDIWGEKNPRWKGGPSVCNPIRWRKGNLRRRGMNEKSYNEMLVKQNGVCAICFKAETRKYRNGTIARLSIDHNHKTGKIRGLLCSNCNIGLGNFKDNIEFLSNAKTYLNKFSK